MPRANEMYELVFNGPKPVGSQSDVDLTAAISFNGVCTKIKGFYDGNNTYKVRLLPEEPGEYTYKIEGVVSEEGTVNIDEADENHHGVVRADGVHLRHKDGTYITTFGTTVYALAHQTDELTEETFKSFECGAFNKVRMCVFPKNYEYNRNEPEHFAFFRNEESEELNFTDNLSENRSIKPFDANRPDFDFWKGFEKKLNRLFEMGIQVDLILFHPYDRWGHSYMSQEHNLIYLDYIIRRLAAYPNIWWSMANEYDLFFHWNLVQWHEIDEFIAKNDPYHHMLSNHNCFVEYDYSRSSISHVSVQTRIMSRVYELQKKFNKPVCYDECCYEGNLKETWGSIPSTEMVNRFWKIVVTGGYCTHGEVLLDDDIITKEQQDNAVLWWAKGGRLKGESPARIKFLRDIIEEFDRPFDTYLSGIAKILLLPEKEAKEMLNEVPPEFRNFLEVYLSLEGDDRLYHLLPEYEYAGHIGEDVFLYYYADDCHARVRPELPEGKTYKIEVIDAWNMTRETAATGFKNGDELRLPCREYMAVLATREG